MASLFDHSQDRTLRIGDFVITKPGNHASAESERHDPLHALKSSGTVPGSVLRQLPPAGGRVGAPRIGLSPSATRGGTETEVPNTVKFLQLVQRQGPSLLDDSDSPGPVLGEIVAVNRRGNYVVSVWRRGDVIPSVSGKREQAVFLPRQLLKLTSAEFHAACRKPYMANANYELMLVGNGYDASTPVALMAYNNRLIASLMQRIDTSVHTKPDPTLRMRVWRERKVPPGAVKRAEPPRALPVLDPLADVREELQALADFGGTAHSGASTRVGNTRQRGGQHASRASTLNASLTGVNMAAEAEVARRDHQLMRDTSFVSVLFNGRGNNNASSMGDESPASCSPLGIPVCDSPDSEDLRHTPFPTMVGHDTRSVIEEYALQTAAESRERTRIEEIRARATAVDVATSQATYLPARYYPTESAAKAALPAAGSAVRLQRTSQPARSAKQSQSAMSVNSSDPNGAMTIRGSIESVVDRTGNFIFRARTPPDLCGKAFVARLNRVELFVATPAEREALLEIREQPAMAFHPPEPSVGGDSLGFKSSPTNSGVALPPQQERSLFTMQSASEPLDGLEALQRLQTQLLVLRPVRPDTSLSAVSDVFLSTGDSLADELVANGLGQALFDAFEDASVVFPNEVAAKLACLGAARSDVVKLRQAQERARQQQRGLWALDGMSPVRSPISGGKSPHGHDPAGRSGRTPSPKQIASGPTEPDDTGNFAALFTAFESSPAFLEHVRRAASRTSAVQ
jgi:hypothetical protein